MSHERSRPHPPRPARRRPPAPFGRWLAVSVVLAGVLAGCGSDDGGEAATAASDTGSVATSGAGAGSTAPASSAATADTLPPTTFEGEAATVDGGTLNLASLAGSDLVVWFWAPW